MSHPGLDELVKDWVSRTYLKSDGWWAQLVLDEFEFLLEMGFTLTGSPWTGVRFHQKGHYVWYEGNRTDVSLSYDPESQWVAAEVTQGPERLLTPLDALLQEHIPGTVALPRLPFDRPMIEANVRWWATGLKLIASDVLV